MYFVDFLWQLMRLKENRYRFFLHIVLSSLLIYHSCLAWKNICISPIIFADQIVSSFPNHSHCLMLSSILTVVPTCWLVKSQNGLWKYTFFTVWLSLCIKSSLLPGITLQWAVHLAKESGACTMLIRLMRPTAKHLWRTCGSHQRRMEF